MTVAEFTYNVSQSLATWIVVTAYLFAFFGLDDLLFDVSYWVYTLRRWLMKRKIKAMTVEQLRASEQQRIAIFVPCWHEEDVVEKMAELTSRSIQYQNYTLFIGVYPNDPATIERAQSAAKRFKHIHVAVNEADGPTTKGQNLNEIYRAMREIEGADPFKIIVMHDVEDVVHPNSMVVYNHLIPRFDMVQIPVFPLEREWHKATAWTYADEFAENHLKDLVIREAFGSFVPSAGVGCAFNRAALATMAGESKDLFPTNSLTEDYQVGLRLQENGYSTIMVHQRLAHGDGETYKMTAASFVATREFFPDTFKTAVRQKTRWIAGICFQAWAQTGWTGDWFTRYTLYRDRKAIVTNMLVLSGYAVLGGSLSLNLWHWLDHRVFLPEIGTHWWQWAVLNFVFCLTILRLLQKAYFVSSLYGSKQGILALGRVPWGAVINAFATARACYVVAKAAIRHESISWSKTAHAFPTDSALHEYRRQLGEVLIEEAVLTSEELAAALGQRHEGERLGETLVRLGFLSERELVGALAVQMGAEAGDNDDLMPEPSVLASIGEHDARRLRVLPLRLESDRIMVAVDDEPSTDTDAFLNAHLPQPYRVLLVSHRELTHALDRAYTFSDERRKPLGLYLLEKGYLTREKLEEVLAEQDKKHKPLFELVVGLHLLTKQQIAQVVEDYFKTPYVHPPHGAALASDAIGKIPAVLLRDNVLALYEAEGMTFVASPFPLWGALRDAILDALGAEVHIVAVDAEELMPLRRRLLKEIEKRRRLGEVLVDDELVSNEDIALALEERLEGEQLGETLVRLGFLSERDLTGVLARQFGVETAATEDLLPDPVALDLIGPEAARHWRILPLRIEDEKVVVAADSEPSAEADAFLRDQLAYPYRFLLVGRRELTYALKRCYGFTDERRKPLGLYLLDLGFVTRHDLDDALNHQDRLHKPLFELLAERHTLTLEQIAHVTNDYFKMPFVRPDHRADIPLEVVRRIPARLLTESGIVVYESDGNLFVAGQVPPGGPILDAILKAIGEEASVVAAPAALLDSLRKKMLHDAGHPDVEKPENLSPAP